MELENKTCDTCRHMAVCHVRDRAIQAEIWSYIPLGMGTPQERTGNGIREYFFIWMGNMCSMHSEGNKTKEV
jgi:hypothetical protein